MISRPTGFLDAIDHLPDGASLVVRQLAWEDYERLLDELADRHDVRVSYDDGKLEIMSPLPEHDKAAKLMERVAYFAAEQLGLDIESYGSATWKSQKLGKGAEADACFYVGNAGRIGGKKRFDLEIDPPPDIIVEVDITSESLSKFSIYAALRVPEIWHYDGNGVHFYQLVRGAYWEIVESRFLPYLKAAMLADALDISKTATQTAALRSFRNRWMSI